MRTLLRFVVIGTLIGSCTRDAYDTYVPPVAPCTLVPDTVFGFGYEDSLRLAVGAVSNVYLQWYVVSCDGGEALPLTDVEWRGPDPAIAELLDPVDPDAQILAIAPGRTAIAARSDPFEDSVVVSVADTVPMGPVAFVAGGSSVSCAVDVGDVARCWGGNSYVMGEYSAIGAVGYCYGVLCTPMPVPRVTGVRSVYVGGEGHACALDAVGGALCWGANEYGQLGTGQFPSTSFEPVPVAGDRSFSTLSLGSYHTCGLDGTGAAYCWGPGSFGRLGSADSTDARVPRPVDGGHSFVSIAARPEATCAVTEQGEIRCWGTLGPLGLNVPGAQTCTYLLAKEGPSQFTCALSPLRIPLSNALGVDTSFVSVIGSCALTTSGSVYCYDSSTGRYQSRGGFGPFVALTAGDNHLCGLTGAGGARCWGENSSGQLGDGTTTSRTAPVSVMGGHVFVQLGAGARHTCGLTPDRDVWCWGANDLGQVGVPMVDDTHVPRRVRGQG